MSGSPVPALGPLLNPFGGFWNNAEGKSTGMPSSLSLPGMTDKAEVIFDDRLVPHIFAENDMDAAYVQGYITAKYRLWQMEFTTYAAAGRLSEILGDRPIGNTTTVDYDKQQRRLGMVYAAENTIEGWKKNTSGFKLLEKYTEGVNTYINSLSPSEYPLEYKLMGYAPEEWKPIKTALLVKSMAMRLAGRENDIETTNAFDAFTKETFDFLYPDWNPNQSPVIPKGTKWDFEPVPLKKDTAKQTSIGSIPHQAQPKPNLHLGSNNWAVHGSRTATGKPILCNDPHLMLNLPSVWFELQISTPEYNAYGVSLPGMPNIIIGFNEYIAWGQTNTDWDIMDWYRMDWTDNSKTKYILDENVKSVEPRVEEIKIKGGKIVYDTVKYTFWGPVVHESDEHPKKDLALRWVAHDEPNSNELLVFKQLNKAKNYEDFSNALKDYECPAQNYVFASKDGDIAINVQGKFPLKRPGQGKMVEDGSRSFNNWQGFIPQAHNPRIKNPERGFVSSANQHSTDPSYPYYYIGGSGFEDHRSRYINKRLSEMGDKITSRQLMELQTDNGVIAAMDLVPEFLKYLKRDNLTDAERFYLNKILEWDFHFDAGSIAGTVFDEWNSEFYKGVLDEVYKKGANQSFLYPETWRLTDILKSNPLHWIFDNRSTNELETAEIIINRSFRAACKTLEERKTSEGEASLEWDKVKGSDIQHMARIPALGVFDLEIGGHHWAPNAMTALAGPSWRMVVELGNEVKAYGVYPGGQSGNPGSYYYKDFIESWRVGEYYPLLFLKRDNREDERVMQKVSFKK